ncbi:MAG TPA: PIN domain-containing protein [Lachnospiraceae bacterium]|nr:PIN domain-containing protein [Lachnospiraceae bacterium]
MLMFLDTNVICSNYYMTGPSFEVAQKVGTIVFGKIVVDEVCNKYKENLEEQIAKANKALQELRKTLPELKITLEDINVADECHKYRDFLEMFILESDWTIAEAYPDEKHEVIAHRAMQRKKPFKADGSTGYRDCLVWLTCLNVALSNPNEEIHFITGNTRDFADSNDKDKLHPDLMADLSERNISETRFFYWSSLKSFIDNYAKLQFDIIEKQETLVSEIEKNEMGFLAPIQEFLNSKAVGCNLSGFDVFVPGYNETLKIFESDVGPQIEEVSELDDDNLLLSITIDGVGVVVSTLNSADIKEIEEYELEVEVINKNDDICDLETTLGVQLQLRAVYSKINKKITSVEIDDIDDYNCPYCPY